MDECAGARVQACVCGYVCVCVSLRVCVSASALEYACESLRASVLVTQLADTFSLLLY